MYREHESSVGSSEMYRSPIRVVKKGALEAKQESTPAKMEDPKKAVTKYWESAVSDKKSEGHNRKAEAFKEFDNLFKETDIEQ